MFAKTASLSILLALLSIPACKGDDDAKKPSVPSAETSAPTVSAAAPKAAEAGKCSTLGCSGEGTFFKMCDCKGKAQTPPFAVKFSGKYNNTTKKPEFEITNTTDKPIHWASAAVYYYDKSGKQLETKIKDKPFKAARVNGSNFTLAPKETKTIQLGFGKEDEPKNVDAMEVVFDGWCFGVYADQSSHLCVSVERSPDDRPRSH